MILLVTPCQRSQECADALTENTGETVVIAESLTGAAACLRSGAYLAVVFDQHLLEAEPDEIEPAIEHLGMAIPVQVNFAISGIDRVVREVRAALTRRTCEQLAARRAATGLVHSELSGTVTALLLQCELALKSPGLHPTVVEKLRSARDLAQKLCAQLEGGSSQN